LEVVEDKLLKRGMLVGYQPVKRSQTKRLVLATCGNQVGSPIISLNE